MMSENKYPADSERFSLPIPGSEAFEDPSLRPEFSRWVPDWWRCWRLGPVSGRYDGEMKDPTPGRYALDLRVDIDPRYANSPVLDKVSGDIFQVYTFRLPFPFRGLNRIFAWRVYRESWIVEDPVVNWSKCKVEISGNVFFYKGGHAATNVEIMIPWTTLKPAGPAEVTFNEAGGGVSAYSCKRKSRHFRDALLEVDVCESVNAEPVLPSYDVCDHTDHPADLTCRTLTIEEAYREAGIDLSINPEHTIVDDSAAEFDTWTDDELHDAMEDHFSKWPGKWPKWHMWCLMAGRYVSAGTVGIMFDYGTAYGGPGRAPERQGCAVFRGHPSLNALVATPPANDTQAHAMREWLKLYVHEIGHGFNFVHSWNKGRPDSLSWMNYDWRYDNRNGADSFWKNFRFEFDAEELIHLRHGDRSEVIPGGDPWATGMHSEVPSGAMADLVGDAPVEMLIRSKDYFQFMEPVIFELRLRNIVDLPLELETQLHPEYGGVLIYIRRPNGRIQEYAPVLCKLATPELKILKPAEESIKGEDRYSQNVLLSYGTNGFYFDEPGEYLVRAFYQGPGDILIPSNVHRVRVGRPYSREEEKLAQDYFSYEGGMALYLNGSSSPYLEKGMDTLQTIAEKYEETPAGAQLSVVLAENLARPFFRIEEGKLKEARAADPKEALALTSRALEQQERDDSTFVNIDYHRLRRTRADLMVSMDEQAEAKEELSTLVKYLKKRGVNKPVLDEINAYAKDL